MNEGSHLDWLGYHGIDGSVDAAVSSTGRSSDSRCAGRVQASRLSTYLLLFLGTAKILGVTAVLTPGVPRLKEWAFAGLTFDLTGAVYSHLSVGDPASAWMPAAIGLVLMAGSYIAYWTRPSRAGASRCGRTYIVETASGHQLG